MGKFSSHVDDFLASWLVSLFWIYFLIPQLHNFIRIRMFTFQKVTLFTLIDIFLRVSNYYLISTRSLVLTEKWVECGAQISHNWVIRSWWLLFCDISSWPRAGLFLVSNFWTPKPFNSSLWIRTRNFMDIFVDGGR